MADNSTVRHLQPSSPPVENPDPQVDLELGVTNVLPFGAWFMDSRSGVSGMDVGNDPTMVPLRNLVEMRKHDGQARALMRLMTLPIRAAMNDSEWIEPDGGAEQEAAFANDMFNLSPTMGGMTVPKHKLLRQTLLALMDGFSVFEEVRQVPGDGPLKGKITLEKLAYRDSKTIRFRVDKRGNFDGVRQLADVLGTAYDVVIPKDKCIYYAANEEENPFYGVSFFEAAYYHYEIKKKLYYIAHLASQFAAVPGRIATMPSNPDPGTKTAVAKAIADFAFNTSMLVPYEWDVQPFNGNTQFNFLALIDHHNTMMAASVLAKFLQQEDRQVLIDNAQSDASADMFVLAIESIMDEIGEIWTQQLMPKYIDWNFGTKKYPVWKFGQLTDTSRDAIKELFQTVVIAGSLNCTPEFVRQLEEKLATRLGLDIDYEEIAKAEEEQAKTEAAAQEQQAAQGPVPGAPVPPGAPSAVPVPGKPGQKPPPVVAVAPAAQAVAATGINLDVSAEEIAALVVKLTEG